ncbi:MAG: hypothetical protein ACJ8J0_14560 [Longimicrobiaceae bacterium]
MASSTAIPPQTILATSFIIQPSDVQGNQITYHFDTMPGNQPNSYGNTVFLWQTSQQAVPINTTPTSSQKVSANQPNGSNIFQNLTVSTESYLVAYAVGSTVQNIVASVFIPATGGGTANPQSTQPVVQVTNIGSTSVSVSYGLPQGMQPQSDGDWIGIWQGGEALLYSVAPIQFSPLASNSNTGYSGMNLTNPLQRGFTYTVGYFKGGYAATSPKQTTLACCTTFST